MMNRLSKKLRLLVVAAAAPAITLLFPSDAHAHAVFYYFSVYLFNMLFFSFFIAFFSFIAGLFLRGRLKADDVRDKPLIVKTSVVLGFAYAAFHTVIQFIVRVPPGRESDNALYMTVVLPAEVVTIFFIVFTAAAGVFCLLALTLRRSSGPAAGRWGYPMLLSLLSGVVFFVFLLFFPSLRGRAVLAVLRGLSQPSASAIPVRADREGELKARIKLDETDADAHFELGLIALNGGRPGEAVSRLHRVVRLDLFYPGVHGRLAEAFEAFGGGKNVETARWHRILDIINSSGAKEGDFFTRFFEKRAEVETPPRTSFQSLLFPQQAVVAVKKTGVYDFAFKRIGELRQGDRVEISGVHDFSVALNGMPPIRTYSFFIDPDYHFYVLQGKRELVPARSLIPMSYLDEPFSVSPAGGYAAVKSPAGFMFDIKAPPKSLFSENLGGYSKEYSDHAVHDLWLKSPEGMLTLLGSFVDETYCPPVKERVSWSPDGKRLFAESLLDSKGKLFSSSGELLWESDIRLNSAVWRGSELFLRDGFDIYRFDARRLILTKFASLATGAGGSKQLFGKDSCEDYHSPVTFEDGAVKASFVFERESAEDLCGVVEASFGNDGSLLGKKDYWEECPERIYERIIRIPVPPYMSPETAGKTAAELHKAGLEAFYSKKYRAALAYWTKEAELDEKNPNTLNNIGIAYLEWGEPGKALEYHEKALSLNRNFGHAHYGMGRAYLRLGDYDGALKSFLRAIELKEKLPDSYFNLGETYMKMRRYEEAKEAYQKGLELAREDYKPWYVGRIKVAEEMLAGNAQGGVRADEAGR